MNGAREKNAAKTVYLCLCALALCGFAQLAVGQIGPTGCTASNSPETIYQDQSTTVTVSCASAPDGLLATWQCSYTDFSIMCRVGPTSGNTASGPFSLAGFPPNIGEGFIVTACDSSGNNCTALETSDIHVIILPAAPDLNQHGLTGSWYEPATSGQGFEVEVFPNTSAGAGIAQVSWFTFDTAAGGADHQRWYTLGGPVMTGQPNAALTIYQNVDGNFNALPVTMATAVGTATLSFATCSSGTLAYSFTDGTGRTGSIPLTRLTQNVTCSTTTPYATNADFALSGNWYAPATSGQGFTVEVNPNSSYLFAAWFTYEPNGTAAGAAGQRWYTAQASFTPGSRSIPAQIYATTGGVFDTVMPPPATVVVGSGTLTFQSCTAATFTYMFTGGTSSGLSGTINLNRVGQVPPGCTS